MLLINKSPLVGVVRGIVDIIRSSRRRQRAIARPAVETPREHELLQHLQQRGWVRLPDNIGMDLRQKISDECLALQHEYHDVNLREKERAKTIWNYLSDIRYAGKKPGENDPLVQYALLQPILNVAGSYLGETPWLRYIILTESVYQPGGISHSQKWHLDFDDARMLKLFVYLSDVRTQADGPFTMMGRAASQRVRNSFFRRHLADEEVFDHVTHDDVVEMYGPRLSSFLVDTSRVYHCGSRMAEGHSRLLYTALFTAFPSIYPYAIDSFVVGASTHNLIRQVLAPTLGTKTTLD